MSATIRRPPRRLAWSWPAAGFGAACALPAALVALDDVPRGMALAVGVLPAALAGIAPTRRGRLAIVVLGVLTGIPMALGGVLAAVPVLAVAGIAALGVGAAALAARSRLGAIVMTLSLPMVGIGLSFDAAKAAELGGLIVLGSLLACAIAQAWPETAPAAERPAPPPPPRGYGLRLGAAGASAAAIGFLLDLDHVGWACAAALLVMRPAPELQRLRTAGRILAVAGGAMAGILLVRADPPDAVYAAAAVAAVAGAAGTHASRWYVTSAFTTFIVFLLLLWAAPEDAASRFGERVGETLLGVGLATLFAIWPRGAPPATRPDRPSPSAASRHRPG